MPSSGLREAGTKDVTGLLFKPIFFFTNWNGLTCRKVQRIITGSTKERLQVTQHSYESTDLGNGNDVRTSVLGTL